MEEKTKEAIIKATFELLKSKDMNSISIREIATKAKVNVATISYYFGGKAQLFAYLMELYWADLIELCNDFLAKTEITKEDACQFCIRFMKKQMDSTGVIRSEQIMYQNYEIDTQTGGRLKVQFEAFYRIVRTFYHKSQEESAVLAKVVALLSALCLPAYWNEAAAPLVGDVDSFMEIYVRQLIDELE